jgi:adenosylcobinamide kinase/adenosylcobinamide-phosphate guanylyltransferase
MKDRAGRVILVIGGASSGKSAHALGLAEAAPMIFVATGQGVDDEMADRIRRHQAARGPQWETAEVPVDLAAWFHANRQRGGSIVVDCITLWLSNLSSKGLSAQEIIERLHVLVKTMLSGRGRIILVTNELGMGVVPFEAGARQFRTLAGQVNQILAREADEVHFVVSGLVTRLK